MSAAPQKVARRPAPARKPAPQRRPTPGPKRTGVSRSGAPNGLASGARRRSAPRQHKGTIAFVVVMAVIVTAMVLGLVALQALLAQESFRIDDLQSRVTYLTQLHQEAGLAVARLSSPSRIATEARDVGMGLPADGIQVLHVPTGPPAPKPGPQQKVVAGVRP